MGTNENIKEINNNFEDTKNIVNKNESQKIVDIDATQRIVILSEFVNGTEDSKSEFSGIEPAIQQVKIDEEKSQEVMEELCNNAKKEDGNIENIENFNQENKEKFEQSNQQSECYHNETLQNNLNEIQQNNSQKSYINETNITSTSEKINNINEINNVEFELNKDNRNVKIDNDYNENKEKKHKQDKKDYRLERMLFDRINTMQGKIKESLELIKKFERINAKEENLPNIVTTLHDKLTQEVIKQFRTVGIEFNMKSYLVQAIVSDLLNKFEEGITEFKDCSENLNFVREVQDDFESKVELAPTSKVKNIFARLRGLFKPEKKQEKLEQLERERQEKKLEEANIHLIKYKFKNNELERYTIKNNITNSLIRELLTGPGSGLNLTVTEFIAEKITPGMQQLGLEELLPEFEEKLYEEFKEKNENIEKQEFFNMQVGDVKKAIKFRRAENLRNKVNIINGSANVDEENKVAV